MNWYGAQRMLGGLWYMPLPEDISVNGHRIDAVIHYIDSVIVFFFGAIILSLLFFAFRYNAKRGHKAVYDRGDSLKNVIVSVLLGCVVFFAIDAVIERMSFHDLKEAFWNFPKGDKVLKVEVMPQQYAWNFRYAGPDGKFATADDIVPAQNQFHVPIHTQVIVELAPLDVIHSFYIPQLRIKQDATPGMTTMFWFEATKEGVYEIACSQLCGNGHYRMRGFMTVESKENFDKWLVSQQPSSGSSTDDFFNDSSSSTGGGVPQNWGWPWEKNN